MQPPQGTRNSKSVNPKVLHATSLRSKTASQKPRLLPTPKGLDGGVNEELSQPLVLVFLLHLKQGVWGSGQGPGFRMSRARVSASACLGLGPVFGMAGLSS